MAYKAAKRMTLAGTKVTPGDTLTEEILSEMPYGKIDSLRRVGYIVEVVDSPQPYASSKRAKKKALKTIKDEEAAQVEPSEDAIPEPIEDDIPEDDTAVSSDPEAST